MKKSIFLFVMITTCGGWHMIEAQKKPGLRVTSIAFKEGGAIPNKYGCKSTELSGDNPSIQLSWNFVPDSAKSIVIIVDDPDAPKPEPWVHWLVFNIPPTLVSIPEGAHMNTVGAIIGKNSWQKNSFGGPCPPSGTHRYFFKVYALDTKLNLDQNATKNDVVKAMQGHVVAEGQLMGTFASRNVGKNQ
jgi:Raf kinase inhibitor-like YbhB/YbcL family protein